MKNSALFMRQILSKGALTAPSRSHLNKRVIPGKKKKRKYRK
jgi:hypothetical protein